MKKPNHPLYLIRKKYNLSCPEFSFIFQKNPSFIYQIESGNKEIPDSLYEKIYHIFCVKPDTLRSQISNWKIEYAEWVIKNKIQPNDINSFKDFNYKNNETLKYYDTQNH